MNLGSFLLAWISVPLVLSMAGYFMVAVGVREFRMSARTIYWFMFGMALTMFVYLFYLFATDQFQFSYIATYSSSDLSNSWPHFYKISALWAGQQGTFLLWLIFGISLGFWVRSKAGENEGWVMFFYILGQTFLLILTVVSNPFEKLNFMPADGQGLNVLLQNYCMQIHPPIVFLGFASAGIPFAFAMASLATNKYDNWVRQTMPWAVLTVVVLGFGIFLGGYWAYETLGWGGYWAWDPVENSSLIPWLCAVALVHGMVVEKSKGTWRRTNIFLAITLFLLIIYGTFLPRSGVLADFSVHSFVDLGYNNILWASIVVMGIISYGLWLYRARKMKVPSASGASILSQEFTTFLAVVLLLPFTALVLFWTSFPLVTTILSKIPLISRISPTPAAIDASNYNMVGIVFAAIFSIILGLNAMLGWNMTEKAALKKKLLMPLAIALVIAALIIVFGFSRIAAFWSPAGDGEVTFKVIVMTCLYFLFFTTAIFAFITNLQTAIRRWKTGFKNAGGYIAHVGLSLMLIGVIFSSSFGKNRKASIPMGDSRTALGYDIKFVSHEPSVPKEYKSNFEITKGDKTIHAYTISKEMTRGNQVQYARTPYIHKYLFSDLYFSLENLGTPSGNEMQPFALTAGESHNLNGMKILFSGFDSEDKVARLKGYQPEMLELTKGQSTVMGGNNVKFVNFEMSQHQAEGGTQIGAILNVERGMGIETVTPYYVMMPGGNVNSPPVDFPGGGQISLIRINANSGSVILSYTSGDKVPDIDLGIGINLINGSDTASSDFLYKTADPMNSRTEMDVPGGTLHLMDINPDERTIQIIFNPEQEPMLATIEISTKPMINLVWIGFLTVVIGAIFSFFRRIGERRK